MGDDDEIEREYCGEYFDKRSIGAHQFSCDEAIKETSPVMERSRSSIGFARFLLQVVYRLFLAIHS